MTLIPARAETVDAIREQLRDSSRPLGRQTLRKRIGVSDPDVHAALLYLLRRHEIHYWHCRGYVMVPHSGLFPRGRT